MHKSAANLENSEGRGGGLPQGGEKGSFRGLEEEHSGRKVRGRLTDCKVRPKEQLPSAG